MKGVVSRIKKKHSIHARYKLHELIKDTEEEVENRMKISSIVNDHFKENLKEFKVYPYALNSHK